MNYDLAKMRLTDKGGLYFHTSDSRKIFTPFKLASEMLDQVKLGENNLVFNMEFVLVLKDMGLINTVWFATVCDLQESAMIALGVDKSRIIRYNYNKLDEFPKNMKFDAVIINPPYEKNQYVDFIRLGVALTKKNGWISAITPRWSMLNGKKMENLRHFIFNNVNVSVINHLPADIFRTIRNGKDEEIRTVAHYFIGQVGGQTNKLNVIRYWNKKQYSIVSHEINSEMKIVPAYLDKEGKDLISKIDVLPLIEMNLEKERVNKGVSCIHGGSRQGAAYVGYNRSSSGMMFYGIEVDEDGTTENKDRGTGKTVVWYGKNPAHVRNLKLWLESHAMKLYFSQKDGGSNINKGTFYLYHDCPITDKDASVEEMYKAAGFSDELIDWINDQ